MANSWETPKKNTILILDSDKKQREEMCALLLRENYLANAIAATADLEQTLSEGNPLAVILDIDTVDIDNRRIRDLTIKYPGIIILCVSKHRFHPKLRDAIYYHVFACLNRPIDPEELFYFLKSLGNDT